MMYPETRNLFIVDDMMGEKDAIIAKLFTKKSHHRNLSVIYIVQNFFIYFLLQNCLQRNLTIEI